MGITPFRSMKTTYTRIGQKETLRERNSSDGAESQAASLSGSEDVVEKNEIHR